ncbi:hypothetical protein SNE40_007443 [Patella caerulea]|uniref:Mitochondrial ribosome-associated GTPase 2 n=1 Tax=Patella caerulea TaxID=87958 RepID=A0AAN8K3L4_PATCE
MLFLRQSRWLLLRPNKCALEGFRFLTAKPVKPHKPKGKETEASRFIDFCKVRVYGGKGGDGNVSFLREKSREFGGPDGGNGGNGGHVIFQASTNVKSLASIDPHIKAKHGIKGSKKHCHGKNAEHTYVLVPVGTVVKSETGDVLSSLENTCDYYIAGRGGAGGKGNHFFLTNEERVPNYAEMGAPGEEKILYVELRTMAHAGLIGFPNAGKSTLLRAISRARPKVASYPFTTLNPHVGMVIYDDHEQIAVADIPGLIEGAHQNKGLGISFLRHIERCACLLYVLDLSVEEPWHQLEALKYELEQYQVGLSERPHAIIGNKIDVEGAKEKLEILKSSINLPVFVISGKNKIGIDNLLIHLRQLYDKYGEKKGIGW